MSSFPFQVTLNTLVDFPRLKKLKELLIQTEQLPGTIVEVGVYKGGTAYLIVSNTKKPVYLFDTFEGMPPVKEGVDLHHKGDFADTSYEAINVLLKGFPNVVCFKGRFPSDFINPAHVYNVFPDSVKFSFVHLDVDIYDSVKDCLAYFYPRMVPGGVIVLDDYLEQNCPGAKLAADEYMAAHPEPIVPTCQSQAIIVKASL